MFSTAPTFPFVAAVKSGYKVLRTKQNVRSYFYFCLLLFLLGRCFHVDFGVE